MNNDLRRIEIELKRDGSRGSSVLLFLVIACIGSFIAWAQYTQLDKVKLGDVVFISEIENQLVQAPQGGTRVARRMDVGDLVKKGELLFELIRWMLARSMSRRGKNGTFRASIATV